MIGEIPANSSRFKQLQCTFNGLQQTGESLICSLKNTGTFSPGGVTDDVGIYYLIPKISQITGLSVYDANMLLAQILLCGAFLISLLGICLLFTNWKSKLVAVILGAWFWHYLFINTPGDGILYLFAPCMLIALAPWYLCLFKENNCISLKIIYMLMAGMLLGFTEYVRSFASIPILFFIIFLLTLNQKLLLKTKLLSLFTLLIGVVSMVVFFHHLLDVRDIFLSKNNPNYHKAVTKHSLWHPFYLGLGYINNPYGIVWDDSNGMEKVKTLNPNAAYLTAEYDRILRNEIIKIATQDPVYIFRVMKQKAIVICSTYYVVLLMILLLSLIKSAGWRLEIAFIGTLILASLPGLVAIPAPVYIFAAIGVAIIYMLVKLDFVLREKII